MLKTKIPLEQAEIMARDLVITLGPYCERIEVSGSIRRKRPKVGDIEIVAVPKISNNYDLFGQPVQATNALDKPVIGLFYKGAHPLKNGPRYKQIELPQGINLDLFIVLPPAQWGVIFTIRTGPAEFSQWIVTPRKHGGALPSNYVIKDGAVWNGKRVISMPEEEDFLRLLGLSGLLPEKRKPNLPLSTKR